MSINFDTALGSLPQSLTLRSQRAEALAANLANADTPGYLARDLPFAALMSGAQQDQMRMHTQGPMHYSNSYSSAAGNFADGDSTEAELRYRIPVQPSVDGNTVDSQAEMATFAQNNVQFEAAFSFLNARLHGLISAIRGE